MAAGGFTRTDNPFPLDDDVSFTVISKLKCASAMPRDDSERDILLQRAAILALIELYHSNPYGDGFKELFQAAGWELFLRYRELRHVPVEGVSTFIYRTTRCPAGLDRSLVNDFYYSTERSCRLDVMGQCYTIWYQTDMHFYADVNPGLRDKYFTLYGEKTRTALRPIDVFKTVFSQLADAAAKLPGRRDEDMAKLLETYENKFPYLYM